MTDLQKRISQVLKDNFTEEELDAMRNEEWPVVLYAPGEMTAQYWKRILVLTRELNSESINDQLTETK